MGGKNQSQKQPDEKLLAETARIIVLETLKKNSPTLAQIDQPPSTTPDLPKPLPVQASDKQTEVNEQILQVFSKLVANEQQTFVPASEFSDGVKYITADYPICYISPVFAQS